MKKYCLYGERCSGTNYIQNLIRENFNADRVENFGHKHFFGFASFDNSDDVLFISVIRNLFDWINSFYLKMHQLPLKYEKISSDLKRYKFLNEEFFSFSDADGNRDTSHEIMNDRNIYTGERYKNIFELRHTKNKFLIDDLPNKVKNHILLRYEDFLDDFENTMNKINGVGLEIKCKNSFPTNVLTYKNTKIKFTKNEYSEFSKEEIFNNKNYIDYYEKKLFKDFL